MRHLDGEPVTDSDRQLAAAFFAGAWQQGCAHDQLPLPACAFVYGFVVRAGLLVLTAALPLLPPAASTGGLDAERRERDAIRAERDARRAAELRAFDQMVAAARAAPPQQHDPMRFRAAPIGGYTRGRVDAGMHMLAPGLRAPPPWNGLDHADSSFCAWHLSATCAAYMGLACRPSV